MDGGASGNTIGSVNVKVKPDLTGFRAEVKAALEAIEKLQADVKVLLQTVGAEKVKAEIAAAAKDQTAKINVVTDDRWQRNMMSDINKVMSGGVLKLSPTIEDESLRRELEVLEENFKTYVAAFDKNLSIEQVSLDRAEIEAELQYLTDKVNAVPKRLEFETIVDDKKLVRFGQQVDKFKSEQLEAANKVIAKSIAEDNDRIRKEAQANMQAISQMSGSAIDRDLGMEKIRDDFERFMFRMRVAAGESEALWERVDVGLYPKPEWTSFSGARARIEGLFSKIPVNFDVDNDARFSRSLGSLQSAVKGLGTVSAVGVAGVLAGVAKGFDLVGSGAAKAAGFIGSFGPLILTIAAAVAVLLPPLLALGAGFAVLAPGLLAILAPIAAIGLGLDGIKQAATDAGLFEDENGDKKGGGALGASLDAIKEKVNETFKTGLKPAFENIKQMFADTEFQGVFTGVAAGLSQMTQGFTNAISKGQGFADLKNIIANVGEGLSAAAPGVEAFTNGFLRLVSAISEKFPGLGDWFTDLGEKFSKNMIEWTTIPEDNGFTKLENLITNVRTGLEGLTNVFQSFWNQGLSDISDPNFGSGMQKFFDGVATFVRETLPGLSEGFKAIGDFVKTIEPALRVLGFGGNVVDMVTSPNEFLEDVKKRAIAAQNAGGNWKDIIAAALTENGDGGIKGDINSMFGLEITEPMLQNAAQTGQKTGEVLLSETAKAMAEAAKTRALTPDELLAGIAAEEQARALGKQTGQTVTEGVQQGLTAAQGGTGVPGAISQQLGTPEALTAANQAGQNVGLEMLKSIQQSMQGANGEGGAGMTSTIMNGLSAELINMSALLTAEMEKLAIPIQTSFTTIRGALDTGFGAMQLLITARASALKDGIASAFGGTGGSISTAITNALQGVPQAITNAMKIGESVNNAMNQAVSSIQMSGGAVTAAMITAFSGVSGAIAGQMAGAVGIVTGFMSQIVSAILSFGGAMQSAGFSVGASFAQGLASSASLVQASASALMGVAKAVFPNSPAKEGPFSGKGWVLYSGIAIGEDFAKGLNDSTGVVVDAAGSMMQQVGDMLNSPQSAETFSELLSLQSQMADLQMNGASKADKAELTRVKDFNSLIQARIKLRDNELKTATKLNDANVKAWSDAQKGIENQTKASKDQAKSVSEQAKGMKESFQSSLEPLTTLTPDLLSGGGRSNIYEAGKVDYRTQAELEALKIKEQQIDMQRSLLQLQLKSGKNPELENQIAILDTQKQRLALQGKELEYWAKYEDTGRDLADRYDEAGAKLQDMPLDFVKATGQQFMQDLGMSGSGMIPSLLTEGTKYIFNVAGVDDALSAQSRLQNKRSLGLVGR